MNYKFFFERNNKRHNRIGIKLNDEELAIMKRKAAFMKMPVGRCVRILAVQG